MKKLTLILVSLIFSVSHAFAEFNIGISGALTNLSSDGTETVKSSGAKKSTSKDEIAVIPSIFIEKEMDTGIRVGLDYVPGSAKLGSGSRADDDAETTGGNTAKAEISDHFTAYLAKPIGTNGLFGKLGIAQATVDTKETLSTGTSYGNKDVNGILIGLGMNADLDNNKFFRIEGTYTDYETVSLTGSADADGNSNKIEADVDAIAFRVSIGKSF